MVGGKLIGRINARVRAAIGRKFPSLTRTMTIRGQPLLGPYGHQLDSYLDDYRFYDYFLPLLGRVMAEEGARGDIVDIGANIGDTILLMRQQGVANRIVAIEASQHFFALLEGNVRNAPKVFGEVRLVNAFVGSPQQKLVLRYTDGTAGTKVAAADAAEASVPTVSIDELGVEQASLVKIDTDGYDGAILDSNQAYFKRCRPVIWAEAYVDSESGLRSWADALRGLMDGYECFYLFDNAGRPSLSGALNSDSVDAIIQLVRAAWVSRVLGEKRLGGTAVAYYDIALVPEQNSRIWHEFRTAVCREVLRETGVSLAAT